MIRTFFIYHSKKIDRAINHIWFREQRKIQYKPGENSSFDRRSLHNCVYIINVRRKYLNDEGYHERN